AARNVIWGRRRFPFPAVLGNGGAAAFNLVRTGCFMPADNNARIGEPPGCRHYCHGGAARSGRRPVLVTDHLRQSALDLDRDLFWRCTARCRPAPDTRSADVAAPVAGRLTTRSPAPAPPPR